MADYFGSVLPSGGIGVRVETNHPLYFLTDDTTRMTVGNSGNVGIGTTSPVNKLEVAGTMNATAIYVGLNNVSTTAYVDIMDLIFNNSIVNWITDEYYTSSEVDVVNTSMKNYVDDIVKTIARTGDCPVGYVVMKYNNSRS